MGSAPAAGAPTGTLAGWLGCVRVPQTAGKRQRSRSGWRGANHSARGGRAPHWQRDRV